MTNKNAYKVSPALVGSYVFTGELSREKGENAGAYLISQGDLSAGANYTLSFVSDSLTITALTPILKDITELQTKLEGNLRVELRSLNGALISAKEAKAQNGKLSGLPSLSLAGHYLMILRDASGQMEVYKVQF